MEVFHQFRFEAAHRLPEVPLDHPCSRLHGHSYRVAVHVEGAVDRSAGWVVDYASIRRQFDGLLPELDHRLLNEVDGLENPTCENLARWIWNRLTPALPGLCQVTVQETDDTGCTYRGGDGDGGSGGG